MKEKSKNKSGKPKRLLSLLLAAALSLTGLPAAIPERAAEKAEAADVTLKNPRIVADDSMTAGQKVTWDCVWFGSYPQAEVIPSNVEYTALDASLRRDGDVIVSDSVYAALQSASGWDANNDITLNGAKYRRMKKEDATYTSSSDSYYQWSNDTDYHYFKYEPIKWRVLRTDGNQALLLSDIALDDQRYHTVYESVTWETSTIRSWLNGYGAGSNKQSVDYTQKNFIGSAFTVSERAAIADSPLENADNIDYGTEGGNNTTDKIFLLSESDVWNTDTAKAHGFVKDYSTYDEARRCQSSAYAKAMGMDSSTSTAYAGNGWWWLRSPGYPGIHAMLVNGGGWVVRYGGGVDADRGGVRSALNLNLSSSNLYTYAGTVCSDGTDAEVGGGTVTPGGDVPPGVDSSQITVKATEYDSLGFRTVENACVEIEGVGQADTDGGGVAHIVNSLREPSAMKRIAVTKEGFRDYIFYTTLMSPALVNQFAANQFTTALKKKKDGDDVKPYISTVMYYQNEIARSCGGQHFQRSDNVTFRVCGVWNQKTPGRYVLYQTDGKRLESEDGVFRLNIGETFTGNGEIYVKLIAADGTESEPEWVYITVPDNGLTPGDDDSYIPILNKGSESNWQTDIPFLNNDKLSFDLGKIKAKIQRKDSKIRIMLGAEPDSLKKDLFDDELWKDWKKFCESQPYDLSLSQWRDVLTSGNLDTHWTSKATIKATGYGWLENDLSADSKEPLSGGLQVVIDLSTSFKQQYVVGVIPVYLEESLGVKGELAGSVTYNTSERKFGGSTKLTITPSLSVGGGVGVLYVAKVGVEGSGSMPCVIDIPKGLTQADLIGSLSLKASVLGFDYSKEMAKATYSLYQESDSKAGGLAKRAILETKAADPLYDMDSYTLPVQLLPESHWYGSQTERIRKSRAASSGLSEKLLQTDVSELTEPMLIQEGDTTLAAFLTEDNFRPTIHRTKLVYTVYDKETGAWSEPQAVAEDGTGDFYPHLTGNNGRIAVSWLNYDASMTNASSVEEVFQSGEICTALWDADAGHFREASTVLSSSPEAAYSSARIAMDADGNLTAAGLKNTVSDIFGLTGDNLLFMEGICGNTAVHREFELSQGLPVTYDVSVADDKVTAAVCVDTDRDLTTLEDREIYLFTSDGKITRVTQNESYDSAPRYAGYQGETALFWYTPEGCRILGASGRQSLIPAGEAGISENFTVVNGGGNQTALVWSDADENQVYQLTASLYDEASGTWSSKVLLSDSEESIFRPSGYYNADGEMEVLYRKGSTIGAGKLYAMQLAPKPDVEIVDAYIEDSTEIPGERTVIYTVVRNLGTEKVTECRVTADGQTTDVDVEILPGESAILGASYTVPEAVSYRELLIQAEVEGDRDISNNQFRLMAGYADVSAVVTEDVWESGKIVHVTAGNHEAVPAEAELEVHKDTADGELVSSMELGTLKKGDLVTVDFTYPRGKNGYVTDANALYYVVTSSVPEKYESDNYDYTVFREKETGSSGGDTPIPPETETPPGESEKHLDETEKPSKPAVRKGQTIKIGRLKYKVSRVNADGIGEAALTGSVTKKLTALNIPDTIRIEEKNFKVTSVEKRAFRNCRKLKKVVFGKHVSAVRAQAFMGCRSLKSVQIKGKALRSISAGAFKKTSAKMSVSAKKLSKKQKAGLMKKFRKAGMSKKAKMR